ncbi:MAG: DMT family transporter [Planctomycetes bacterium]|nr:DMT family transporter [Planctomycetota bacterium]
MTSDQLGKTYALLNAVVWAIALVLFKQCGKSVPPLALNLFKNVVGIVLIVATILLLPQVWPGETLDWPVTILDPTARPFWILVISGVIGVAIADTIFFYGLNLAGVGVIAIVDCLYTPYMMLFAWWLLGEKLTLVHYLGGVLIVVAVFLSTGHKPPADRTRGQIALGALLAAIAVGLMAYGIVLAKPVLDGQPVLWTTLIRVLAGTAVLGLFAPIAPGWRKLTEVFRPSSTWTYTISGSFFGAYLAMVFWVGGMANTKASIAAMLNQCSTVFAILFATVFLRERLTIPGAIAVVLAGAGVMTILFHEHVAAWIRTAVG